MIIFDASTAKYYRSLWKVERKTIENIIKEKLDFLIHMILLC
jgi:Holliday junction resolvase RusA-like endonuclease